LEERSHRKDRPRAAASAARGLFSPKRLAPRLAPRNHRCDQPGSVAVLRVMTGLAIAIWFAAAAGAAGMKASAPDKMMPQGGGQAMRECDKLAVQQNVKMADRARFVKDCVAKKMK
jgi:hypothetical protein